MGVYPDNTKNPNDAPRVETIVELVKRTRHMAVGLVTTTRRFVRLKIRCSFQNCMRVGEREVWC